MENVMPHSLDMEKNVLACMIMDEDARLELISQIKKNDFYNNKNRIIYNSIVELDNSPKLEVDINTLMNKLVGEVDGIGSYLSSLLNVIPTAHNYKSYAKIVKQDSLRRNMIRAASKISNLANDKDMDITQALAMSEQELFNLQDNNKTERGFKHVKDFMIDYMEEVHTREATEEGVTGIRTGFNKLDDLTGGLQKEKLYVVAGRPGFGKSSLALNIGQNALLNDSSVGILSLEMGYKENMDRMLSYEAKIEYLKIIRGLMSDAEKARADQVASGLYEKDLMINDTAGLSLQEIRSEGRKMKKKHDVDLIVVDYLTLVSGGNTERDDLRISSIARNMKNMAKELKIPVILLAQLSRSVEQRNDKRPFMSDLKGSSGIEDAADMIMLLYREGKYNMDIAQRIQNVTEVIVAKNRNGQDGLFLLDFDGRYYRFEDIQPDIFEEYKKEVL